MKPHLLRRLIDKIARAKYEAGFDAGRLSRAGYELEAESLRRAARAMGDAEHALDLRLPVR